MISDTRKIIISSDSISSYFIYGFRKSIIFILTILNIFWIALKIYYNPIASIKILKKLLDKRKTIHGNSSIQKYVKVNNRYFWSYPAPGWPSKTFNYFIENELKRIKSFRHNNHYLQTMIFSVTNKCQLSCEHCFDWENINGKEHLEIRELKEILRKFQTRGINHVQLSGGEPLCRLDDIVELISTAQPGTDFWLLTSGYELTLEKAAKLKDAGLTGVNISLDHWNEKDHNIFRKNEKSYYWVKEASLNCHKMNLVISFSLCAVKEFITNENLMKYLYLVKDLGGGFIQILEPRKVGHFAGKDVELKKKHFDILRNFYLKVNSDSTYREMPVVVYPGFHQRSFGCFGAGNRYLYVDSHGDLHACPFCQQKVGNVLNDSLDESIEKMQITGCHRFRTLVHE